MQATAGTGWPFGGPFTYIEDVFSTWLYTGNSSTQTITNGIDLAGEGGMVWTKARSSAYNHSLRDTVRGRTNGLSSNLTDANVNWVGLDSFNSNGYSLGDDGSPGTNSQSGTLNYTGTTYASWTFRKQPKFFDIVTYTGNGANNRVIPHNLGSVPGMIITKRLIDSSTWGIYHRSLGLQSYILLNTAAAAVSTTQGTDIASVSATDYVLYPPNRDVGYTANASGETYVAYLFAHNAGGFGLTGNDNVISCGSFTTDGSGNATVNLGYEPQWLLTKSTDLVDQWYTLDSMRGWPVTTASTKILAPNTSGAETTGTFGNPTATGFTLANGGATKTYIYIAIRRGPMKVPTDGTKVFAPSTRTGTGAAATVTGVGFTPDFLWSKARNTGGALGVHDRLRGTLKELLTNSTAVEYNDPTSVLSINMDGYSFGTDASGSGTVNASGSNYVYWNFKRAPGFFDEVCYTGTSGVAQNINHNLGVAPELIIVKSRSVRSWPVYAAPQGNQWSGTLDSTFQGNTGSSDWNSTTPTASVFSVGVANATNSSENYVAYLFASCPGVSKVGSYTGTATTQQINCGFTAGARFVLIKRTDSTGDWYVYDSARGIVAGNDPYILNITAAEVTGTDYVDTYNAGFELSSTAPAGLNANGGTYIFLAIA